MIPIHHLHYRNSGIIKYFHISARLCTYTPTCCISHIGVHKTVTWNSAEFETVLCQCTTKIVRSLKLCFVSTQPRPCEDRNCALSVQNQDRIRVLRMTLTKLLLLCPQSTIVLYNYSTYQFIMSKYSPRSSVAQRWEPWLSTGYGSSSQRHM